ncbi:hypothetical protein N7530_010705 [Penicillium desertorum]|uniref:Aldehyde dehydrogenase domain-containing protein n=1 Tax=Penicillium desertorum TaxID=1303715 RepID=A0A9X0BHV8_9EURO|nr:hypothetical protein N7530_010705 [Penicillium desertorum]
MTTPTNTGLTVPLIINGQEETTPNTFPLPDLLEARLDTNAEYVRQEMGTDIGASAGVPVVETEGQSAIIFKEAMGVILGIVPWNAPYVFGIRSAACALAAGNTTILKSLPASCLNIIHCAPQDAPEVVNAMIEHDAVRKINFTGSTAVGRKIARACGQNLSFVLWNWAGRIARFPARSVWQLIESSSTPPSLPSLHGSPQEGPRGRHPASDLPPTLVNTASKTRIEALIASAVSAGAHFISGSADSVPTNSGEEAFASVAACMPFDSEDGAIRLANGSGAVHINSVTIHDEPALPHGGVKNSGWGRFNTDEGLNEFLVRRV